MKYVFYLFLFAWGFVGQAQTVNKIELSETVKEERMGVWTRGDYQVYIPLAFIADAFRINSKTYAESAITYHDTDSATFLYFEHTSKRYQRAAEQIEKADHGFDLRSLIVYAGMENEKDNVGHSKVVEAYVKQVVQNGTAMVFFKGERIYTLQSRYESKGEAILDHGYEIRIYVDDPENYLFQDYQHLGW